MTCTRCLLWMPWRPHTHCPGKRRKSMTLLRSARCSTPSPTTRSAPLTQFYTASNAGSYTDILYIFLKMLFTVFSKILINIYLNLFIYFYGIILYTSRQFYFTCSFSFYLSFLIHWEIHLAQTSKKMVSYSVWLMYVSVFVFSFESFHSPRSRCCNFYTYCTIGESKFFGGLNAKSSCHAVRRGSTQPFFICCFQGAAVLRMLSEFLTEPVFAKGLSVSSNSVIRPHHLINTATVCVCRYDIHQTVSLTGVCE